MYICEENGELILSADRDHAVVSIEEPICYRNGKEIRLTEREDGCFSDDTFTVFCRYEKIGGGLFRLTREWKNIGKNEEVFQSILRVTPLFAAEEYCIPCVNLNGNGDGRGKEPKGLTRDGKPWIYAYDRVSIPSLTVTEGEELCCGLFASAESSDSLISSCSIFRNEAGSLVQELRHPVTEAPYTYIDTDKYGEPVGTFLRLLPGETVTLVSFLCVKKPKWRHYGVASVIDEAFRLFPDITKEPEMSRKELWDHSVSFARSLITDYKGKKGFIIGFLPDENGTFRYRADHYFELGWAGQNILLSEMMIENYRRYGDPKDLSAALEILDTRVRDTVSEGGLMTSQLCQYEDLVGAVYDTCNMGYGVYRLIKCYQKLKALGIDRDSYLTTAEGVCRFFKEHYSETSGFGKVWRADGTCTDEKGTVGAYMILPYLGLYHVTCKEEDLQMAEKSFLFYAGRDLDRFRCSAGALDTNCIDKETATPLFIAALDLYRITGQEIYLTYAEKAAYYYTSWMYFYQPVYGEGTQFREYGICAQGLTAVSVQHHHLDAFGEIVVPCFRELAAITGEEKWNTVGTMMWNGAEQVIGDGKKKIHGLVRMPGSQNEGFLHCSWGGPRGTVNDWLVAWPCAFRLAVLAEEDP